MTQAIQNGVAAPLTTLTLFGFVSAKTWAFAQKGFGEELNNAIGLIASIGIGEAPFFRQATFSLWSDETAMSNFAYKSPVHQAVIRKTRQENWYKEELFARFTPVASEGKWNGCNPLENLI